ncbi:hypothetical protein JQK87_33255 [Streptomyces sp. G44]|uniref:hypothetical protein n=1 Tax=Streptomyces sp. G44 TaxID=2807632 RepID=UPI00195F3DBC|nr:hypothetical protein [Streptomyces sp. G44]MBM7173173.1 hypothetical protein [Streptomyces sp. G44]
MRALPVRRIAAPALCATLLIGTAGTAFALAGDGTPGDDTRNAHRAPAPAPETMLAQAEQLHDLAGVLTPSSELLTAVLRAPGHKLSPADVDKHSEALKRAVDAAGTNTPASMTLADPTVKLPQPPERPAGGAARDKAPADPRAGALSALQKADAKLLRAAGAGDAAAVRAQAPAVVDSMVNVVAATMVGGDLPAPSLPGVPPLPKVPAPQNVPTGTLPQTPAVPKAPAP